MTVTKSRLIYTAGTFTITAELAVCRRLTIYSDVLRLPYSAKYSNERSNPVKRFLGYVSLFIGDYVASVFPLEYDSQVVLFWDNPDLQNHQSLLDLGNTIQETIVTLGAGMTPPVDIILEPAYVPSFTGCPYTKLKFKLEPGCRIQVSATGEEVSKGTDFGDVIFVPNIPDVVLPYDSEVPREEDPPRSEPEEGELPGDTAPATPEDPEASPAVEGTWTISWLYSQTPGAETCPFVGTTDVIPITGTSTDEFSAEIDGANYRLYQNGEPTSTTVGSNCTPSFTPEPVFVPD